MGRASSSTRGWRSRSWNADKHPRDAKGQFAETPDLPKPSRRVSRSQAREVGKQANKLVSQATKEAKEQQERRDFLAGLSSYQRRNLYGSLTTKPEDKPKPKPEDKPKPKPEKTKAKPKVDKKPKATKPEVVTPTPITSEKTVKPKKEKATKSGEEPKEKQARIPTLRRTVSENSLKVSDGKVELWVDKPKYTQPTKGYKVIFNRNYEYSVLHEGEKIVLNNNKGRVSFDGEVVNGLPPLTPKIKSLDNGKLVADMAKYASYVEDSANPPAPNWLKAYGSPDRSLLSERGLGQVQLHHQGQWTKKAFSDITERYEKGEIDLDTAKKETRELLTPYEKTLKNGKTVQAYEISVAPKGDREFVALAGGAHDFTSPLYAANHPLGIHPDTGKLTEFGIPAKGRPTDGNRDEYDAFRNGLWRETYRREAKILSGELTRRLRKGDITPEEIQTSWKESREKQEKFKEYVLNLRKEREEQTKG